MANPISQQSREAARKDRSREEDVKAPLQLIALIVHRNLIQTSREESRFEKSKQEAHSLQTAFIGDQTLADGDDAPADHKEGEPGRWRHALDEEIRRHFE